MYQRPHVSRLFKRVSRDSNMRIVAITGPRQVGKTTIALQVRQRLIESRIQCWYIPMDDIDSSESDRFGIPEISGKVRTGAPPNEQILAEIWKQARRASLRSKQGLVMFLDEIQIVPRWSNLVKGLWDTDRRRGYPLRVVILGSAAWRMLVGQNESLAGRFDSIRVTHWSPREMIQAFGLTIEEFIFFGGYPSPFNDQSERISLSAWREYISDSVLTPIIDRDIMGLTRIRKPALMRQLIDLAPSYSGQLVSYNKLLGQLQDAGNATTLASYLDLLSDAGLVVALTPYTPSLHLGRTRSPKLNVLNTALMTATSSYSFQEAQADRRFWGRIVESAVGAHLYNTRNTGTRIHFWRHKSGKHEVDFVISRGPHLVGVEVKSKNVRSRRGLDGFKDRFPNAKTMVVPNDVPFNEFFSFTADEWIEEL